MYNTILAALQHSVAWDKEIAASLYCVFRETLLNLRYVCELWLLRPLSLLKCIGTWQRVAGTEVLQTVASVAFWRALEILKIIHTKRVTWGMIGSRRETSIANIWCIVWNKPFGTSFRFEIPLARRPSAKTTIHASLICALLSLSHSLSCCLAHYTLNWNDMKMLFKYKNFNCHLHEWVMK